MPETKPKSYQRFFGELKRRQVFGISIAVIVAWAFEDMSERITKSSVPDSARVEAIEPP